MSEEVQAEDFAGSIREETSGCSVGTTVFVQELMFSTTYSIARKPDLDELLLGSTLVVRNGSLVAALGEEFDGGERPDIVFRSDGLVFRSVGIHLCDNTF